MPPRKPAPTLPGFTLIDWLGGGGFADVFRYRDHALGREVAIKVLHRGVNDATLASFQNEASLMAKMSSHPNIVSIFQVGAAKDGRPYLVMEMCRAPHLGDQVARRLYSPAKAMEVGIQIAGAVETAHRLGVLHRDIKPANILFTDFGRPALTDFGISVSVEHSPTVSSAMSPQWAAPERFGNTAAGLGPWTDVYSLAATIWASMVGHSPMYQAGQPNDLMHIRQRIASTPLPRTGRADVPEELERVLAVGMAKDPGQRFQSAIEFARALQGVQAVINQAVTAIDVFTEHSHDDFTQEELQQEGTRIQGFVLIDPEQAEPTDNYTGPTSGITTPSDRTGGVGAASATTGVQHNPNLLQHGYGTAPAGVRDFTVNPWPELAAQAEPTPAPQPVEEPPAKRSIPTGWLITVALAAVVVLIIGVVFLLNQDRDGTAVAPSPSVSANPADPLQALVPQVTNVEATVTGDQVTFTWINPDPQEGDVFRYQLIDPRGEAAPDSVVEPTVSVTALEGDTCVDIYLVRSNGRSSQPVRGCAP